MQIYLKLALTAIIPGIISFILYGAPAGIIAGLIGGIERYLSPWSADYTRVACTTATILSGFVSGLLRIIIFDDKRPSWVFGVVTAAVIEVCHMLMVFATH